MRWISTRLAISAAWSTEITEAETLCIFHSARFRAESWLLVASAALAKSRPPEELARARALTFSLRESTRQFVDNVFAAHWHNLGNIANGP
ncbi:MAG: hypothetical protein WB715_18155 [Roseiarcus sp.]|uniref:hypothetical protein n=1 Tax=Roseiarcus sp. TaxID=1969460 RepID=UPI003C5BF37F